MLFRLENTLNDEVITKSIKLPKFNIVVPQVPKYEEIKKEEMPYFVIVQSDQSFENQQVYTGHPEGLLKETTKHNKPPGPN